MTAKSSVIREEPLIKQAKYCTCPAHNARVQLVVRGRTYKEGHVGSHTQRNGAAVGAPREGGPLLEPRLYHTASSTQPISPPIPWLLADISTLE